MRLLIAVTLASLLAAQVAFAEEAPPAPLLDRLKAAEKAAVPAAWIERIREVPAAYASADKKQRKALMKRLGVALKSDLRDVAPITLRVLVKIDDGDVAWSEALRQVMPTRKQEQMAPLDKEIFGTVHVLSPDAAIDTLLDLMRKAKSTDIAAWSMRALGGYERSPKRVRVLDEMGKTLIANAPGRKKGGDGGPRWNALRPYVAEALNNLTGQRVDLKTWGPLWFKNRKQPAVLFVRPLPK